MQVWLVVSYEPLPGIDGDVRFLRYGMLGSHLAAQGHEVTFWTSTFDHVHKRQRSTCTTEVELQPGFRVQLVYAPGYTHNRSPSRWIHNRKLGKALVHQARKEPLPDVIVACLHAVELSERIVEYACEYDVPVVLDVVDRWPDIYLTALPTKVRPWAKWLLAPEYARSRRVLLTARSLTAVSATYLQWALDLVGRKRISSDRVFPLSYRAMDVPPNPTTLDNAAGMLRTWGIDASNLVVAFLGMFAGSYDLETVVDAARLLETRGRNDIRIVLAGAGDKDASLRARARGLRLIQFAGWLDREDGLSLLRRASVGLAPYTRGTFQSLPYKPFEYMANGMAILSSLPGELNTLVRSERIGETYQPGDSLALANLLEWCADHREDTTSMGERARSLFEQCYCADIVYEEFATHVLGVAESP